MSRSSLEAAVPPNTEILLDTSVVLAYLNASEAASPAATVVIDDFVRTGRNRATISVVSVAEMLVRPLPLARLPSGSSTHSCSTSQT